MDIKCIENSEESQHTIISSARMHNRADVCAHNVSAQNLALFFATLHFPITLHCLTLPHEHLCHGSHSFTELYC